MLQFGTQSLRSESHCPLRAGAGNRWKMDLPPRKYHPDNILDSSNELVSTCRNDRHFPPATLELGSMCSSYSQRLRCQGILDIAIFFITIDFYRLYVTTTIYKWTLNTLGILQVSCRHAAGKAEIQPLVCNQTPLFRGQIAILVLFNTGGVK